MKIYIDFDGTLFDTNMLYNEFINVFTRYNIDRKYIERLINDKDNKDFDMLAKKIVKDNNLDSYIYEEINKIYYKDFIFKDVISFLEEYYKKYDLILLTLGNNYFQKKKINSSNISKYFKEIIITNKDKSKLDIDYSKGIFIDNNMYELKKFYKASATNLIRIKRDNDKYSKIKSDIDSIREFKDFEELLNSKYIEKIGEIYYE